MGKIIMIIKKIKCVSILDIWTNKLWPGRESKIEPTNGLLLGGGWTKDIMLNPPTFFGAFDGDILVGVNSGHKAELIDGRQYYRSRGIYVNPKYRGQGIAQELLKATEEQGKLEGCTHIWSMPRESSLKTYLNFGFEVHGDKIVDMEFGPNFYVSKII